MANLKELKIRIASVKSTQKITKAMQMVAASKLRKAQERAEAVRPYTDKMEKMLSELSAGVPLDNAPKLLSGHIDENGKAKNDNILFIVATADRGLCGGFNSSIVKEAKEQIDILKRQGKNVKLITIGKKGLEQLTSVYGNLILHSFDTTGKKQPEFAESESAAEKVIELFDGEEIDVCKVIYSKFVSPLEQTVTVQQLIPLESEDTTTKSDKTPSANAVFEYEPNEETVLSTLLPHNIAVQIYRGLLENAASEQGARMTAMDNATRNAGDMIDSLTLVYNRSRQAAITTELTEIVAGAEAV